MLTKKKFLLVAVAVGFAVPALASEGAAKYQKAGNDVSNIASLQRGARNFVNYCYGCHSAQYVRYNRVGADLGLSEEQVIANLMFTGERPSETMRNAMAAADAQRWFGKEPPDLSLIARSKGTDYVFAYMKSFYLDPSRPTGMNNTVLPGASMPHVLWELQGTQEPEYEGVTDAEGNIQKHFKKFTVVTKGSMSETEYDLFLRDTVNFLDYIGEPMQMQRRNMGVGVLMFILVFFGFTYFLKKEYWKDVK